ncbi:TPA: hypothetical protein ACM2YI_004587 [Klebsiella pneumoniae]|uniref:hypothetical protein n=1 Tax=Klebsiella pneumoniae TaxID=573 RepID=UPI000E6A0FC9|nr:hypothetical protein [Klebsiella pneumoniae]RIU55368.1 hypothetical protein D1615_21420 [Klebsiella pneumoniae]
MTEITRARLELVARPVFALGAVAFILTEKFLKLMPLTVFWVVLCACLYLDASVSVILDSPGTIIKLSMIINMLLSASLSLNQINNTFDSYFGSCTRNATGVGGALVSPSKK